MSSSGDSAICAFLMAVTALVTPGPAVTAATPMRPVGEGDGGVGGDPLGTPVLGFGAQGAWLRGPCLGLDWLWGGEMGRKRTGERAKEGWKPPLNGDPEERGHPKTPPPSDQEVHPHHPSGYPRAWRRRRRRRRRWPRAGCPPRGSPASRWPPGWVRCGHRPGRRRSGRREPSAPPPPARHHSGGSGGPPARPGGRPLRKPGGFNPKPGVLPIF